MLLGGLLGGFIFGVSESILNHVFHVNEIFASIISLIAIAVIVMLLLKKYGYEYIEEKTIDMSVMNVINQFPLESTRKELIQGINRIDQKELKSYDGSESGLALSNSLNILKQVLQNEKTPTSDVLAIKSFIETLEKSCDLI
jgi:hypothetical protein